MSRDCAQRPAAKVAGIVLIVWFGFPGSLRAQAAQAAHAVPGSAAAHASAASTGSVEGDIYFGARGAVGLPARAGSDVVRIIPADALRRVGTLCRAAQVKSDSLSARSDSLSGPLEPLARTDTLTADELERIRDDRVRVEEERADVQREAARQVRALLLQSATAEMRTGASAHYKLSGVRAGSYAVWAERTTSSDDVLDWIAFVTVKPGETIIRDLDSSAEESTGLYCGFEVRAYWLQ